MELVGQAGLGAAGAGLAAIAALFTMLIVGAAILLPAVYYLPEIAKLISDWVLHRDVLAESEESRRLEGRLFDPDCPRNQS